MIRTATPSDRVAVRRLIDGANLAVSAIPRRLRDGTVLLAVPEPDAVPSGTIVLVPVDSTTATVEAIAVRRSRRNQGIGTALVEHALDRYQTLCVDCAPDVRPFWASLGFELTAGEDGRYYGCYSDAR